MTPDVLALLIALCLPATPCPDVSVYQLNLSSTVRQYESALTLKQAEVDLAVADKERAESTLAKKRKAWIAVVTVLATLLVGSVTLSALDE